MGRTQIEMQHFWTQAKKRAKSLNKSAIENAIDNSGEEGIALWMYF